MAVIGISTGTSTPFRTTSVVRETLARFQEFGLGTTEFIELSEARENLGGLSCRADLDVKGEYFIQKIEKADVLVVGTPVFRGPSAGVFRHLFELVNRDLLSDKLVLLCATLGNVHELVFERQSRARFGFFEDVTVAATIYGGPGDFTESGAVGPALKDRIARIARMTADLACVSRVAPALVAAFH